MRWLLLSLGILVLAIGVVSHVRHEALGQEFERQEQEAQRQAVIRQAQAREGPRRAVLTYERPEDPVLKASQEGEFYLLFPAVVWLAAGAAVTVAGLVVLLATRRAKSKDAGAQAAG